MKFTAVIPTYNREKDLEACFFSIEKQTLLPNEILIIDDGNLDKNFIGILKERAERKNIELNYYKKNHEIERRGLSESKNRAIDLAKNEIIFYLDDDLILENDFFENIMKVWRENKDEKLIGVGGKITNNREKKIFEIIYNYIFGLESKVKWNINDVGFQVWDEGVTENVEGYYAHGGVSSFRKELLGKIKFTVFSGGRTSLEDVDFCLRAKNLGYHLIYTPHAKVLHNHSKSGKENIFVSGEKEGKNRKIIFQNNCKKNIKNYLWFFWANVGWILRQFLAGHFRNGAGMIVGIFSKTSEEEKIFSKLKGKNLGFFMTMGVSLSEWQKVGMLSREIEPINLMAEYFNKVYFFTYGGEEDLKYKNLLKENVEIVYKKSKINNYLYSILMPFVNRRIIKKIDILKTNQMLGAHSALLSKWIGKNAKLIIRTGYSLSFTAKQKNKIFLYRVITIFERFIYRYADFSLVTSKKVYDILVLKYKVKKEKVKIVANYINTDIFKPDETLVKNENKIVYVGRVVKEKNILSLIEALEGLNIELDIVGGGNDPFKDVVVKKAREKNVIINFLGNFPNSELPKVLNRYNIFILPSFYEGMPKTLLEAMGCGLACIGTDVEGIKEVIKDGENGLLASTDSANIKEAIISLKNDKNLQNRLGKNARKYIVDNFSIHNQIKKEIRIYEEIA